MRRARDAGMTLIELMVSLVVVAIAVGFTFRIFTASSAAYHSQQRISELQQSLRTAKDQVVKDVRMAGFMASQIHELPAGAAVNYLVAPFTVIDNPDGTGPDQFTLAYADTSCEAHVQRPPGPPFNAAESSVDSTSCFADGDIAFATRVGPPLRGQGCVLQITNVQPAAGHLQHHPLAPWNDNQNHQCDNISGPWTDGNTVFTKFVMRSYRIAPVGWPGYQRGILQMNPTGAGDPTAWQDLAYGFVDMQVALRVYDPAGTDVDGDGDPLRNWFSGPNMNTVFDTGNKELLQVRLTLVARTNWPIDGVMTSATPSLTGLPLNNNSIGDEAAFALVDAAGQPTITDKNDRRYGNHIFRSSTSLIDMRNLGIGH